MRCATLFGFLVTAAATACNKAPSVTTILERAAEGRTHIQADLLRALDETCCPDEYNADVVERCFVSVDGIARPGIYMQAPALCRFPVYVHAGARFVSWITLTPQSWVGGGDGAEFLVSVISSEPPETVIVGRRLLDPQHYPDQRRWVQLDVTLEPWGGMPVILQLSTSPGHRDDDYHDWCVWGEPKVSSPPLSSSHNSYARIVDALNRSEVRLDHDFLATKTVGPDSLSAGLTRPLVSIALQLPSGDREGLYAHPPWSVSRWLIPGPQARLATSLGLLEECWMMSNGVDFAVEISRPGTPASTIFQYWLCPQVNACDRDWVDVVIDLSMYAGETIMVTLRTEGGYAGNLSCDGAAWARPVVVSRP